VTTPQVIAAALRESGVEYERPSSGAFVVNLPGTRRLKTACWLTIGEHAVSIEAFVVRKPDENAEQVYRYLLEHNARMYAVAWSIDDSGDIYLTGKLPLAAVTPEEIDRVLGAVLEYADGSFNALLQLGFGSSIRREWAWRAKNGESLANLAAFEAFAKSE
jgi:Putative bacterial sensory transduction regulator